MFWTLAALLAAIDESALAWQLALWAAAVLGFVPFNFPRARIFMGDVGSGVLGFLIAVAVIWQLLHPRIAFASGLVACSRSSRMRPARSSRAWSRPPLV